MAASGIVWRAGESPADLSARIRRFGERFLAATFAVAQLLAAEAEDLAKVMAPWHDRSSNARQGLKAVALQLGQASVAIVLYHGMSYGKWLELANQTRYAVILPTLVQVYPRVMAAIRAAFGGA